jgi:hypothetical protein
VSRPPRPRYRELISPAGAGLVAICFFLPWLRVSCGSKDVTLSGSGIGGAFWMILGAAIVALVTSIICRKKVGAALHRAVLLFCALFSAGILAYKYVAVAADPDIPFYIPSSMVKFEFRPGAIGVLLGLSMVSIGAFLAGGRKDKNESMIIPQKDPKIP